MTPKEKAEELFNKFGHDALKEVDNVLKNMSLPFGYIGYSSYVYLKEVKKEIEKL
jgi:hypothetical protein